MSFVLDINILALLLVALPLVGAAVVGLACSTIGDSLAQKISCTLVVLSALISVTLFTYMAAGGQVISIRMFDWFSVGDFRASWSVYVDQLTSVMLVVVTVVSALVHIYSVGYMSHDPHKPRFMSYLSLFTFCMLMLVTSDNFIQLFFGWEGVGVCSYLLIGFWYHKETAANAAIKAFLVNRVGDIGLALGIFFVYITFNSVEFAVVFPAAKHHAGQIINIFGIEANLLTVMCLLLFMGAMGKSAQLGLHTWLPDAMEGPTPVSALIHAATMVTAGVFLVARCSPLFEYSATALAVVTIVGATTCLFAASIALVQNDIKRIIAYSTCSQLGYMFFACGVSAYSAGIFHLMTHGFFKALLFLGAGSVIHAMSDEQDIRKMGGIWKMIPFTYAMMWIGSLALAGVFPFAGFYSKDIILESAYAAGTTVGVTAYWMGILAAIFTAFYSWRLIIMVFHGTPNASNEVMSHVHESPKVMTIPLFILSIGAVLSGYAGAKIYGLVDADLAFWGDSVFALPQNNPLEAAHHVAAWVILLPSFAGLFGIGMAYFLYMFRPELPSAIYRRMRAFYIILLNKYFIDELYDAIFVRPAKRLGSFLWKSTDSIFIDGMPNGAAYISKSFSRAVAVLQTGFIYHYAFVMLLGLLGILTWIIFITG